jgi:hypothetical protein
MIFEPERRLPVPSKDLLSYVFDDSSYDIDRKVGKPTCFMLQDIYRIPNSLNRHSWSAGSSMSTFTIPPAQSHIAKLEQWSVSSLLGYERAG